MRFPDHETWSRLDGGARERLIDAILAVLEEQRVALAEGTRFTRCQSQVYFTLDDHFRRTSRAVFVACNLAVFYPAEPVIVPDVLVVRDCDADIEPETWVVPDQKRGIDLVIEVRSLGKRHKDVAANVRDYARRQIPEYFSFDCRSGQLRGWRLPHLDAETYQPIVPQGGMLRSQVLELDLAVVDTKLRFFVHQAMIPTRAELVDRLQRAADERQRALDDTSRRLDDTLDRLSSAQVALATGILALCDARGVALNPGHRATIVAEGDVTRLARWMSRAAEVTSGDALFTTP